MNKEKTKHFDDSSVFVSHLPFPRNKKRRKKNDGLSAVNQLPSTRENLKKSHTNTFRATRAPDVLNC